MPTNYQEPIEKKDLDTEKKFSAEGGSAFSGHKLKAGEKPAEAPVISVPEKEISPGTEKEAGLGEKQEEKVAEKIETARKTIGAQKATSGPNIATDARLISETVDYEKKVEKLVELALQKGPDHAIKVAQHMDKGKSSAELDNYTLDEIHDRLLEEELRNQLIQKGLLKEL
ncbi:MAG: hypothetical protein A3J76_02050 [Candidatus Moranbacteria bacterium RBG_13_45_13]|nr:MAG: hypothetical protein A3J76_02050 [Candidatus Moranbacteria bacterium RBG_13_45_13]